MLTVLALVYQVVALPGAVATAGGSSSVCWVNPKALTGIVHVQTATLCPGHHLRLSAGADFTPTYDVGDGRYHETGYDVALAWYPHPAWQVAASWIGKSSSLTVPQQIIFRSDGGLDLQAKFSVSLHNTLSAGVALTTLLPFAVATMEASDALDLGVVPAAASVIPQGLLTWEYGSMQVGLSLGAMVGNSTRRVRQTPTAQTATAFNLYTSPRMNAGVGGQVGIWVGPWLNVVPFVEWSADLPVTPSGSDPSFLLVGGSKFALQTKIAAQLILGANLGLAGVSPSHATAPVVAPWSAFASVTVDLWGNTSAKEELPRCVGPDCGENATLAFSQKPKVSVQGRVLDRKSQNPIAKTRVVIDNHTETVLATDSQGRFTTWPLDANGQAHQATVSAPGYITLIVPIEVDLNNNAEKFIFLDPQKSSKGFVVRGAVIDAKSAKALDISVLVAQMPEKSVKTQDGQFEIELPAGSYDIVVSSPHYKSQRRHIEGEPADVIILNVDLERFARPH